MVIKVPSQSETVDLNEKMGTQSVEDFKTTLDS
jgi:hypothetical protein